MMLLEKLDKDKLEVVLRIGLCCLCAFSLSIAYIPQVVPRSQSLMPGVLGASLSLGVPTLCFSLGAVFPSVICIMIVALGFTTMLLACVTVSDGLFVGIFAVFALFMTTLYAGKNYDKTAGFANTLIALAGLFGLSYRPLVQAGGLETVRLMWTESGTENSLAVWRNFLIALCWGIACVALCILVPPIRTSRRLISRSLLPRIFSQVNKVLTGENVDLPALAHSWNALGDDGSVANTTIFEPRVLRSWSEDLVTPLKALVIQTDHLILKSLLAFDWKPQEEDAPKSVEMETIMLQDAISLLSDCGDALSSNNETSIQRLKDSKDDKAPKERVDDRSVDAGVSNAGHIYRGVDNVRTTTYAYLRAFNHPKETRLESAKERTKKRIKSAIIYIAIPLLPTMRLAQAILLPFHPQRWNLWAIMYSLELVAGYVILIALAVYWEKYSDFRITPKDEYVGPVYSGWHMLAYAFALLPTLEGTIKKGFMRALGTCIGGFSGWLGIIVCSWSYDDSAPINPYGLVAWLTITTMLQAYFLALEPGAAARMGASQDYGFVGVYAAMTQAIIALEVYLGAGDKNGLTVNRIVATISGVVMAMIVMLIPPHVKGGDPKYSREYLSELQDAFTLLLRTFADESSSKKLESDEFQSSLLTTAREKRKFAVFVWKDANRLKFLPYFKVDPELRPLLENMTVTESLIWHLSAIFSAMVASGADVSDTRRGIQTLLDSTSDKASDGSAEDSGRMDDLVAQARRIQARLEQHESTLKAEEGSSTKGPVDPNASTNGSEH